LEQRIKFLFLEQFVRFFRIQLLLRLRIFPVGLVIVFCRNG
jgi:hypothetical protein